MAALAGLSMLVIAASGNVSAQIVTPPPLPKAIEVFPARDFVLIDGYADDADVLVQVRRGNSVVGVTRGRTSHPDPILQRAGGFLEVNHPGGVCWQDVTPDIVGYDVVQVTYDNTAHNQALQSAGALVIGSGAATRTAAITVQKAAIIGETVVIKGKALQGITPIPLARIEVSIRNKDFLQTNTPNPPSENRIDKQDIRITSAGADVRGVNGPVPGVTGTLVYDAKTAACPAGCFTATFIGLNATERNLAIAGDTSGASWQAVDAAGNTLGLTIYEASEFNGPGMANCPPGPGGAIAPNPPAYPVPYNPLNLVDAEFPPADLTLLKPDFVGFPARDFVGAEGWPVGTDLQIVVRRADPNNPNNANGVIVGTARGTTYLFRGVSMLEVNHPGGVCWSGQTPDLRDGDRLDVFEVVNNQFVRGQTQRIIGVKVTGIPTIEPDPANPNASVLVVRGTKPADQPLERMAYEIVNPDFRDLPPPDTLKDRVIGADTAGGRVRYDNGTITTNHFLELDGSDTQWKATFRGLSATLMQYAIRGASSISAWLASDPNPAVEAAYGLTIFEYGETNGPGMGGCPSTGGFTIPIPLP
jgi:hypothetical protein